MLGAVVPITKGPCHEIAVKLGWGDPRVATACHVARVSLSPLSERTLVSKPVYGPEAAEALELAGNQAGPAWLRDFASVIASQMPTITVTRPATRFQPIASPSRAAPNREAVTGLTVTETATRVGEARPSA
jgi:hypothetical protein